MGELLFGCPPPLKIRERASPLFGLGTVTTRTPVHATRAGRDQGPDPQFKAVWAETGRWGLVPAPKHPPLPSLRERRGRGEGGATLSGEQKGSLFSHRGTPNVVKTNTLRTESFRFEAPSARSSGAFLTYISSRWRVTDFITPTFHGTFRCGLLGV